ncbi:hypothetical protein SDC9_149518 [bioreactor metagenome]|uniref:Uncharacterized protein n=1 Tax=bioreactor metagenome TaxID=1076179 RepID=A0A645ELZ3_9ZZZZ
MNHFGVELDAVEIAFRHMHGAEFGVAARPEHPETAFRHSRDLVAVRHPDLRFRRNSGEEFARFADFEDRLAVFARFAAGDLAAEGLDHKLEAVADAVHRNAEFEHGGVAFRRVFRVDAGRAAGEDDPLRIFGPELFRRGVERHDFAVHPAFADSPRDQLTVLRAEIEDDDRFTHKTWLLPERMVSGMI